MKNRISKILAIACALTLVVASLALFTDQASTSATAKAGNLNIAVAGEIEAALDAAGDTNIANSADIDNWNPGDNAPFSYTVSTTGNKAVRYQETIKLTVSGMDAGEAAIGDAMLTITGTDDANPVFASTADGYTITYTVEEGTLDGTQEDINGDGTYTTSAVKNYALDFNKLALNEYQDADIKIDVDVVAVQFANTQGISEYVAE